MVKFDLREQAFSIEERITKKFIVNMLWVIIALVMIFGTVITIMLTVGHVDWRPGGNSNPIDVTSSIEAIPMNLLMTLGLLILYFALKLGMTVLFCSDKINSINLKVLENKGMPVCFCREALKTWQTVVMYLVPVVIVYGAMAAIAVYQVYVSMEYGFLTMLLFMSFFLAFDLALIFCVLFIKIKEKIDYISINYHVYEITLYKRTLVTFGGKAGQKQLNQVADTYKTGMFIKETRACGNQRCANYGQEIEESPPICPVCGKRTYKAEIFEKITTCVNTVCANHGQELDRNLTVCSVCGEETGKLSFKFNPALITPSVVMALITVFAVCFVNLFIFINDISYGSLRIIMIASQFVIWGISLIMGFLSKSKKAIITTIISLPAAYIIYLIILAMLVYGIMRV